MRLERVHISERSEASDLVQLRSEIEGQLTTVSIAYVFLGVSTS